MDAVHFRSLVAGDLLAPEFPHARMRSGTTMYAAILDVLDWMPASPIHAAWGAKVARLCLVGSPAAPTPKCPSIPTGPWELCVALLPLMSRIGILLGGFVVIALLDARR
jgi:hypothetical protein